MTKLEYMRKWRKTNRDKVNAYNRARYRVTKQKYAKTRRVYRKKNTKKSAAYLSDWKSKNPVKMMLYGVKNRAIENGWTFDLTEADIHVPPVCPILGIPIGWNFPKGHQQRPSLDRVDNSRGYTKDNIAVISVRANYLKNACTIDDLQKILRYVTEHASHCK